MSNAKTSLPAAPGCTTFGTFCRLPDFTDSSLASTSVVSAATLCRLGGLSIEALQHVAEGLLVGADTDFPMAVSRLAFNSARAYFVFNPLDPLSRRLMEESTVTNEFQLVLLDDQDQRMSCCLRGDLFGEVLRCTRPNPAQSHEAWVAHAVAAAPALPALLAECNVEAQERQVRQYAMLMVARERMVAIRRTYPRHALAW